MNARDVRDFCKRHGVHPRSVILLAAFARTAEGQRFAEGGTLCPQFVVRHAPRKPRQRGRSIEIVSLDWLDEP